MRMEARTRTHSVHQTVIFRASRCVSFIYLIRLYDRMRMFLFPSCFPHFSLFVDIGSIAFLYHIWLLRDTCRALGIDFFVLRALQPIRFLLYQVLLPYFSSGFFFFFFFFFLCCQCSFCGLPLSSNIWSYLAMCYLGFLKSHSLDANIFHTYVDFEVLFSFRCLCLELLTSNICRSSRIVHNIPNWDFSLLLLSR